jgi:hypothetical protein
MSEFDPVAEATVGKLAGDLLDEEGYPTETALNIITQWPFADPGGALDLVKGLWNYPEYATNTLRPEEQEILHSDPQRKYLRLATGGWSGNESLIRALRDNQLVWSFTWQLSKRGGLHIFRYPNDKGDI